MVFQPTDPEASIFPNRGGIFGALRRSGISQAIVEGAMRRMEIDRQQKNIEADRALRERQVNLQEKAFEADTAEFGGRPMTLSSVASIVALDPELQEQFKAMTGIAIPIRGYTRAELQAQEEGKVGLEGARQGLQVGRLQSQAGALRIAAELASKFTDAEGNPLDASAIVGEDESGFPVISIPDSAIPRDEFKEQIDNLTLLFGSEEEALTVLGDQLTLGNDLTRSQIDLNKASAARLRAEADAMEAQLRAGGVKNPKDVTNALLKAALMRDRANKAGTQWNGSFNPGGGMETIENFHDVVVDLWTGLQPGSEAAAIVNTALMGGGAESSKAFEKYVTDYFVSQAAGQHDTLVTLGQARDRNAAIAADPQATPAQVAKAKADMAKADAEMDKAMENIRKAITRKLRDTKVTSKTKTILGSSGKEDLLEMPLVDMLKEEVFNYHLASRTAKGILQNIATRNPDAIMAMTTGAISLPSLGSFNALPDPDEADEAEDLTNPAGPQSFLGDVDSILSDELGEE